MRPKAAYNNQETLICMDTGKEHGSSPNLYGVDYYQIQTSSFTLTAGGPTAGVTVPWPRALPLALALALPDIVPQKWLP